jgi:hypothetical protein
VSLQNILVSREGDLVYHRSFAARERCVRQHRCPAWRTSRPAS